MQNNWVTLFVGYVAISTNGNWQGWSFIGAIMVRLCIICIINKMDKYNLRNVQLPRRLVRSVLTHCQLSSMALLGWVTSDSSGPRIRDKSVEPPQYLRVLWDMLVQQKSISYSMSVDKMLLRRSKLQRDDFDLNYRQIQQQILAFEAACRHMQLKIACIFHSNMTLVKSCLEV